MAYRKIVLPLTGGPRDEPALACAFEVAKLFNSHVTAVFVKPDATEVLPYLGEGISSGVVQEILDASAQAAAKAGEHARASLVRLAAVHGFKVSDGAGPTGSFSCSFALRQGFYGDVLYEEALLSDLAIFDGPTVADQPALREALETVLLSARRPILLLPDRHWTPLGAKAAIGWDGGLAAAHAVTAAMPWLTRARAVEILQVSSGQIDTALMDRLRDYLRLNGVEAVEHGVQPGAVSTGAALIDAVQRCGADLLVMGGYGHSRWREMVLGGVTRHVLANVPMPVFMAH